MSSIVAFGCVEIKFSDFGADNAINRLFPLRKRYLMSRTSKTNPIELVINNDVFNPDGIRNKLTNIYPIANGKGINDNKKLVI